VLTGVLQLLGAVGLVVGLRLTPVGVLAATGLSALMLLGVGVRRRIHDSVLQTLPAAGLAALNALLVVLFLGR
jgi:hypothetical protein